MTPGRQTRGFSLIEMMVAVTILSIGAALLAGAFEAYQDAARRARYVVAIAEVLNLELETARACPSRACLTAWKNRPVVAAEAETWLRPRVQRTIMPGPDGTLQIQVVAEIPSIVPPRTMVALVGAMR